MARRRLTPHGRGGGPLTHSYRWWLQLLHHAWGHDLSADVGVTVLIVQKGADETGEESSSHFTKVGPAYVDLINLLNRAGVSAKLGMLALFAKNRNTIRIEVGRKPQASSTWDRQLGLVPVIESRQEDRNPE